MLARDKRSRVEFRIMGTKKKIKLHENLKSERKFKLAIFKLSALAVCHGQFVGRRAMSLDQKETEFSLKGS